MSNLYNKIFGLCEMRGVKPGKMCADTGLSRGMVSDLKMGRTKELSAKNTKVIADYFGVSVDYLLGVEQEKTPADDGGRNIKDDDIKAAFWGGEKDLSPEDIDLLWADARDYIKFKTEQKKRGK